MLGPELTRLKAYFVEKSHHVLLYDYIGATPTLYLTQEEDGGLLDDSIF